MNEELLSFLWRQQRFRTENLCTTDGEPVQVIYPGLPNTDAGPDFQHARIRIGDTLWAGNVELHTRSGDWLKHGHQHDEAYAGIILHVVYECDTPLNLPCPELELRHFVDPDSLELFENWRRSISDIPCNTLLSREPALMTPLWLDRLLVERMEERSEKVRLLLQECSGHWESAFFIWIAHYFGVRVNTAPFELLARSLPWKLVQKYAHNRRNMEALFLGQAGFLEGKPADGYQQSLQEEYRLMREMFGLQAMGVELWKFLRLRPANFPCLRISQFAGLWHQRPQLLYSLIHASSWEEMVLLLESEAEAYWGQHSRFGQVSGRNLLRSGMAHRELLLANAVLPFLFVYADEQALPDLKELVLDSFRQMRAEDNRIIRRWKEPGVAPANLGDSQALVFLYNSYCKSRRCLSCEVGSALLSGREPASGNKSLHIKEGNF